MGSRSEIYLCRHGQTLWTLSGQHTGRTDLALTDEGVLQAERLRQRISGIKFSSVVTSPLRRARQTCELLGLADQSQEWPDLREWDYGDFEGLTTVQIRQHIPDWNIFTHGAPGGESLEEMGQRVRRVMVQLRSLPGPVAVISHGHFLRVLGALWIDTSVEKGESLDLAPSALCILGSVRETYAIKLWNETWCQAQADHRSPA